LESARQDEHFSVLHVHLGHSDQRILFFVDIQKSNFWVFEGLEGFLRLIDSFGQ